MVDSFLGFILLALGISSNPTVLGENTATPPAQVKSNDQSEGLRVMKPKFTPEDLAAFQKERAKREANLKRITDARTREQDETFAARQKKRKESDVTNKTVLENKIAAFRDSQKQKAFAAFAQKYSETMTSAVTKMHTKLTAMQTLLDRINAAAGALETGGTDVSEIESKVTTAQAAVINAQNQVSLLAESLPTTFTVANEDSAKEDVRKAIEDARAQMKTAKESFAAAHEKVREALAPLEELTDAEEVGQWPVKK